MVKQKNIFLTGITGFLGSFLAVELLKKGYKVFGLARPAKGKSAYQRTWDAIRFAFYNDEWDEQLVKNNLKVVEGDIVFPDLGIKDKKERAFLVKNTDIIIHSAALAELRVPLEVIRKVNVEGTRHVLDFGVECKEKGRLQKFNHISTMYVCGDYAGEFDETMLDVGQKFNNTYEQSKFEAEVLVRQHMDKGLNCSIFRPSLIMGDSKTGKTNNFKLFYQPLHFFANELYDKFPGDLTCRQNLINIDTATKITAGLVENNGSTVYHVISPNDVKLGSFISLAAEYFGFKMPEFIPAQRFGFSQLTTVQKELAKPFLPYLNDTKKFNAATTRKISDQNGRILVPTIDNVVFERIFKFCVKDGFIKERK